MPTIINPIDNCPACGKKYNYQKILEQCGICLDQEDNVLRAKKMKTILAQIKRYSRPSEDAQPQLWAGEFDELQQLLEEMD